MIINIDELMKLREAATPGPWKHTIESRRDGMGFIWPFSSIESEDAKAIEDGEENITDSIISDDAAYIVAACNAVPELVARIRELERQKTVLAVALSEYQKCKTCIVRKDCPNGAKGGPQEDCVMTIFKWAEDAAGAGGVS